MTGRPATARSARRRTGRVAACATLLAAATAVPVLPVLPVAPAAARAAAPAAPLRAAPFEGPVTVDVTGLSPTTLAPGGTLTVSGRLRNTGPAAVRGLRVDVRIRPERLQDRAAVRAWADSDDPVLGQVELSVRVPGRLDPGESVPFQVRGDVADFDLPRGAASFGPRAVTVQAVGTDVPRAGDASPAPGLLGERRTFTVWNPDGAPPTTQVGVLVPLVLTRPVPDASAPTAETLSDLAPTGRIGRLTGIGASTPGLTWAVDPALLLAAARATGLDDPADTPTPSPTPGDGGSPSATAGDPTQTTAADPDPSGSPDPSGDTGASADVTGAQEWLDTVRATPPRQDLWALPFGDPDLAALGHDRQVQTLRTGRAAASDAARRAIDRTLPTSLGWPADGLADEDVANVAAGAGITDLVLAGTSQPSTGPDDVTAAPRSAVVAGERTLGGLVADDTLSATFARAGRTGGAQARQQLVAELAALARENLTTSAAVVLTAPRDWEVDAADLSAALKTLSGTPWLRLTPASELGAAAPTRTSSTALTYPEAARAAELPRVPLRTVADARRRLGEFAGAFVDPDPIVVPLRREALSLAGLAWRQDPDRLQARATNLARTVDGFYESVRVPPGSDKLLLARTAELPLTVENRLTVPVRVVVALRPRSGRLVVVEPVTVEVPPQGRTNALVPVRAIADGDVEVEVSLFTPDLVRIAQSTSIDVDVRSDWESRGIALVAGALLLLLLVGLFRGVRRGRRPSVPLESVPDPDDVGRVLVDDDGRVIEPDTGPIRLRRQEAPEEPAEPAPDPAPEARR